MKENKRIISMDLIRIFSCLCVITCHFNASISGLNNGVFVYANSVVPNFYLENRLYLGDIGTSLFFILSGASSMLSYKKGSARLFYKKRFLSMFPMFYVAYIVATIADFFIQKGFTGADWKLFLFSLIGFDGYLASLGFIGYDFYKLGEWFLGCILSLYLVFPWLHKSLEKKPICTTVLVCGTYVCYEVWAHMHGTAFASNSFFLRIPEFLLGMLFIKYNLQRKTKLTLGIASIAAILGWLLRNHITPLTFCICMCLLLFAGITWLGNRITGNTIPKILFELSGLTYPVFLVHHWMISRLVVGFDLANMSRRSSILFYAMYLLLSFMLANILKQVTSKTQNILSELFSREAASIEN